MGSDEGEGGNVEGARKEFLCPVCRQGGLETLEEAVSQCQPKHKTKEEDAESEGSTDTKQEIIEEIKRMKAEERMYRSMQISVHAEDRRQMSEMRKEVMGEILSIVTTWTDAMRGEMRSMEETMTKRVEEHVEEKVKDMLEQRMHRIEKNVGYLYGELIDENQNSGKKRSQDINEDMDRKDEEDACEDMRSEGTVSWKEETRSEQKRGNSESRGFKQQQPQHDAEGGKRKHLSNTKRFESIKKYNGKIENFFSWKYKVELYLEKEYEPFGQFLQWIEKKEENIKEKDLEEYEKKHDAEVQWMSQELYYLMAAGVEENSTQLAMVQNLRKEEKTRGPNAWRAVVQEAVGMNGNRLLGLANQIHSPPRVRSYAEVLGGVERWARSMQEYEEATKTKVHDASRIAALKKIVPMELAKDLSKLKNLNDYEEARQYILEQVSDHKEQLFGPNPGSGKGPAWQQADMSVMEKSY